MEQFTVQARYNKWMNEHFYCLCDSIADEERKRDAGAFFKSIHGTLNHILLGDRLWMSRFQDTEFNIKSLDQELYSDYAELKKQRGITDNEISLYIDGLTQEKLNEPISFITKVNPSEHSYILRDCILHLFQHQIHHRGQLSTLISQLGIDIGVTDLMWMPGIEIMSYQPISCDLHSQYELAIMHKSKLELTWLDKGERVTESNIMAIDIKTKNKAEFLIAKTAEQDELNLRLDQIIEMRILK